MARRKKVFAINEYYHVYNRGVEKRKIFRDRYDVDRFLQSMIAFNTINPVGSLRKVYEQKNRGLTPVESTGRKKEEQLVDIVAYCLNPNHFHLLLYEKTEGGISEFMKRVLGGYTWYFNNKYKRSGTLLQGRFQSSHVDSNEYLLHVSVYVNLNFCVHQYKKNVLQNILSSFDEYRSLKKKQPEICTKESILGQFKNKKAYVEFAEQSLIGICERKKLARELTLE